MPTDENRRTNREILRLAATYTEFNNLISSFANYMPENSTRLQVSDEQVTALNTALVAWIAAYNAYANPDSRNRAAILQIENEYKADSEMIRMLPPGMAIASLQGCIYGAPATPNTPSAGGSEWSGLVFWLGLAWLGLAWLGLAWLDCRSGQAFARSAAECL